MKYFIFKHPRKPNDIALETLDYEPMQMVIQQKTKQHNCAIVIISEEDLKKERVEKKTE